MTLHKVGWSVALAVMTGLGSAFGQVPPAEQLLPDDVTGVFTVPDYQKLIGGYEQTPWGKLWNDPAMKPFRENFSSNFQADFIQPVEKELGIKLSEYKELLRGQITLAITPPREGSEQFAGFMLLIDAKDKSDLLTTKLAELRKKWTDAGRKVQSEKIRDVEFSTLFFNKDDLEAVLAKAFPSEDASDEEENSENKEKEEFQVRIGQFKSLLIVGDNGKAIEKMLARQAGGLVPPLAEKAAYQKVHTQMFRDSLAHGWINVKPIYEKLLQVAAQSEENPEPGAMPGLKADKILPVLGLSSIESIAGKVSGGAEGTRFEMMIGAPEGQREGLLKLFTLEKKDSAPPAFVPADVLKFQRTRLDAPKAFATLEGMLSKIDPTLSGFLNLMLSSAGKDQDPNFDLRKNLIGNMGDDFIQYEKAPKTLDGDALQDAPMLVLIGSPNPAQLLDAMRMITSLLPPPLSSAPLKEREFLGKKIYSLSMGALPEGVEGDGAAAAPAGKSLSFSSSAGYVAFSTDDSILEEYLRSGENPPKPLRAVPGFAEAAQKAGGTDNGFLSYENQAETMRIVFDVLKRNPDALSSVPVLGGGGDGEESGLERLFKVSLLPSYDRVAKYFGITVAGAGSTPEGFVIKAVAPAPSGSR